MHQHDPTVLTKAYMQVWSVGNAASARGLDRTAV